jgi:hypothetical protein
MSVTIQNLEASVLRKVENRTSDTGLADQWIRDSLLEIASDADFRSDFAELEVLGPTFNLTANTNTYPETDFFSSGLILDTMLDITLWIDYPSNTESRKLDPSHYQEIDKLQTSIPSTPIEWCRFGGNIIFFPTPDQAYQTQARGIQQHPITDYFNAAGNLNTTVILLPNDWLEAIVYGAALRGFNDLGQYDSAAAIRSQLYGDPSQPGLIGLLKGRKKKREREAWRSTETNMLRPRIRRISAWRS